MKPAREADESNNLNADSKVALFDSVIVRVCLAAGLVISAREAFRYLGVEPMPDPRFPGVRHASDATIWIQTTSVFVVGFSFVFMPSAARNAVGFAFRRLVEAMCHRPGLTVCVFALLPYALGAFTTPTIAFGRGLYGLGYGHDGLLYGQMAEQFGDESLQVAGPMNQRILVPALVYYSGLNTFTGFRLLNTLAHIASCWLLYRIVLHHGLDRVAALASVFAFATLKFGTRFLIYYPILMDGVGMALMLAVILTSLQHRTTLYMLSLCLAATCRENIFALIPFYLILNWRRASSRNQRGWMIAAQLLPITLLLYARLDPLIPASGEGISTTDEVAKWIRNFFQFEGRTLRALAAYPLSLGPVLGLVLLHFREAGTFAQRYPAWAYYVAITLGMSLVGGFDVERFAIWQFPAFAIFIAWATSRSPRPVSAFLWLHLCLLHIAAMGSFIPWDPRDTFYLGLFVTHIDARLLEMMLLSAASSVAVVLLLFFYSYARETQESG